MRSLVVILAATLVFPLVGVGGCAAFSSAVDDPGPDAADAADASAAMGEGGDASEASMVGDARDEARAGLVCTERAPAPFPSRSACESAAAPSVSGCAPADAGTPSSGEPCDAAPSPWCSCVESTVSANVELHVRDCTCLR